LRLPQDGQRRRDRQRRDEFVIQARLHHNAATEAQEAQEKLVQEAALRANAEAGSNNIFMRVVQAQANRILQDDYQRRERELSERNKQARRVYKSYNLIQTVYLVILAQFP
jgi:hypothetical protein